MSTKVRLPQILLLVVKSVVNIWDFLTLHIYTVIQNPQKTLEKRAVKLSTSEKNDDGELVIRGTFPTSGFNAKLLSNLDKLGTMADLMKMITETYGNKKTFATRKIIREFTETQPSGKVMIKREMGDYKWSSYKEVNENSIKIGHALRKLGVLPRQRVVIYANTSADWMLCCMGCLRNNITLVTVYTTLGEEGTQFCLQQSGAKVVITSADLLPKLMPILDKVDRVETVLFTCGTGLGPTTVDKDTVHEKIKIMSLSDILSTEVDDTLDQEEVQDSIPKPDDVALIMYTSGSSGRPKGVVISQESVVKPLRGTIPFIAHLVEADKRDNIFIAYLPQAHIYELMVEMTYIVLGVPIGFSSPHTLLDTSTMIPTGSKGDISLLRPTIFTGVPLVFDRIVKGIKEKVRSKGEFPWLLLDFCYQYKKDWVAKGYDTPIMNRLIFGKFRQVLGGKVMAGMCAGAPLSPEVQQFCITTLCFNLVNGYGMTETTAQGCVSHPDSITPGIVGGPYGNLTLKLVDWPEGGYTVDGGTHHRPRGEIVVGGKSVASHYLEMEEETNDSFFTKDGMRWFRSGDIGEYLENGGLAVIDRKSDIIKLQNGEFVCLGKIETVLRHSPLVENVCVYCEPGWHFVLAILMPDHKQLNSLALSLNKKGTVEELCKDALIKCEVIKTITDVGKKYHLGKLEIPKDVLMLSDPWTPESGLVTTTFKLKRKIITITYKETMRKLYMKKLLEQ